MQGGQRLVAGHPAGPQVNHRPKRRDLLGSVQEHGLPRLGMAQAVPAGRLRLVKPGRRAGRQAMTVQWPESTAATWSTERQSEVTGCAACAFLALRRTRWRGLTGL